MLKKTITYLFFVLIINQVKAQLQSPDTISLHAQQIILNENGYLDSIGIDTLQYKCYVFDEYEKKFPLVVNLGQTGTASLPLIFADRKNFYDFPFADNYYNYILPFKHYYYKTDKPYTKFKYDGGMKYADDQYLDIIHTQTHGNSNFGVYFKLYTAQNFADYKENSSINNLNTWYHTKIKKFDFLLNIRKISIKRLENGGFIDTSSNFDSIDIKTATFFLPSGVSNSYKSLELFSSEAYNLNENISIRHSLSLRKFSRIFSEDRPNTQFFGEQLVSDFITYDSTGVSTFQNKLSFIYRKNYGLTYSNSIKNYYYFRGFLYNLRGETVIDNFLKAFVNKNIKKLNLGSSLTFHFTDINAGDLYLNFYQKFSIKDSLIFVNLNQSFAKFTPSYFYQNYVGNYNIWHNYFDDTKKIEFSSDLSLPSQNFSLTYKLNFYNNMVYWDSTSNPTQYSGLLALQTFILSKEFSLQHLIMDFKLVYQKGNNDSIINVPEFMATTSIYFDFGVANDALHLNFGTNVSFYSKFYEYAYNPAIGVIHLSYRRIASQMPLVNLFLTGRIKSALVFLRFDNATGFLLDPYRETVEFYHLRNFYFNFGVQWWFKN